MIGLKRFLLSLVIFTPLVSANPISIFQEVTATGGSHFFRTGGVTGIASWYSEKDQAINRHTANGDVFDDSKMTCASWHYAFGTVLEVTNLKNGKSVFCRVNDRGPAKRLNRVIDLTKSAFKKISDPKRGLIQVGVREADLEEALLKL